MNIIMYSGQKDKNFRRVCLSTLQSNVKMKKNVPNQVFIAEQI